MNEIGSEFELDFSLFIDSDSFSNLNWLNLPDCKLISYGRTALKILLKNQKINKCLIPSYLCESILQPFNELNIEYDFYKIKTDLSIDYDYLKNIVKQNSYEAILIIDYFGLDTFDKQDLIGLISQYNIITINDITHSFIYEEFNNNINFYFASLRKWLSLPDGAFLVGLKDDIRYDTSVYEAIWANRLKSMLAKTDYISNHRGEKTGFLSCFNEAEDLLNNNISISEMSVISKYIISKTDWISIVNNRIENYNFLLENFPQNEIIKPFKKEKLLDKPPLGFVVVSEHRDKLKEFLIKNCVYPPIHWNLPSEIKCKNNLFNDSIKLSNKILTIPCDQRYNINDMKRIIEILKGFIKIYG